MEHEFCYVLNDNLFDELNSILFTESEKFSPFFQREANLNKNSLAGVEKTDNSSWKWVAWVNTCCISFSFFAFYRSAVHFKSSGLMLVYIYLLSCYLALRKKSLIKLMYKDFFVWKCCRTVVGKNKSCPNIVAALVLPKKYTAAQWMRSGERRKKTRQIHLEILYLNVFGWARSQKRHET